MALDHRAHFVHGGFESSGDTAILKHAPREGSHPPQEQGQARKAPPPAYKVRSAGRRPGTAGEEDAFVALAHAVEAESPGSTAKGDRHDWDDFVLGEATAG